MTVLLYILIAAAFLMWLGVYLAYPLKRYWHPFGKVEKRTVGAIIAYACTFGIMAFSLFYFARSKPYGPAAELVFLAVLLVSIARGVYAIRKRNLQAGPGSTNHGREA